MLHEVGRDAHQRTAESPIARDAAAANGVDHDARGVGTVFDREPQLELERGVAEAAPFHAEEADLVVALPGDVVARTDVDHRRRQGAREHALHRLRLGAPLQARPGAVQHVQEVCVAPRVQLVGPIKRDAAIVEQFREHAVDDGRAQLRLDVVPDDRDPPPLELGRPLRVRGDEDGDAIDEGNARLQRGPGVVFGSLLASDGQIVEEDLRLAPAEHLGHLGGPALRDHECLLGRIFAHVLRDAIEHRAHLHDHRRARQLRIERPRIVRRGERGHVHRLADLALVDVEGTHDLDVARPVAADVVVHEAHVRLRRLLIRSAIELDPLQETARAVSDTGDADRDLAHMVGSMRRSAPHILDEGRAVNRPRAGDSYFFLAP